MANLKIALVQQKAIPNNSAENLKLAVAYSTQACEMGADIVLFPELWSNGYAPPFAGAFDDPLDPRFEKERVRWLEDAFATDSAYVQTLRATANRLHIGIVATYLAKTAGKPQNTALVIDRDGTILLSYAKVHTCDFSLERLLQCGDAFKVCEFDGVQLGVMICYDREFPESARVLMLQGAEIILVPNACAMNSARLGQLNARAFENMVGVAMANYPAVGWGQSCAFSPLVFDEDGNDLDNTISKATDCAEQLVLATFAVEKMRAYRQRETWGNAYRKVGAYRLLQSDAVRAPFVREK